jgi:integrase
LSSLFKHRKIWYISVKIAGKARVKRSLGTTDKKVAQALFRKKEIEILQEILLNKPTTKPRSRDSVFSQFLNSNPNWSEKTHDYYMYNLKVYKKDGVKHQGVFKTINVVRNWCHNEGISHNIPKPKKPIMYSARIRVFTKDELDILLNKSQPEDFKRFIQFAYYTGARSGEIRKMKKKDISKGLVTGKSGYRTLKLTKQAQEILDLDNLWEYTKEYVSHKFKQNTRALNIKDARFHDLRRSFGYHLLKDKKVTFFELSKLLGHRSVITTERHYTPLLATDVKDFKL